MGIVFIFQAFVITFAMLSTECGHIPGHLHPNMTSGTIDDWLTGRMWWEGTAVCTSESVNHTTIPEAKVLSDTHAILTSCRITGDIRICQTLKPLNATTTEEILTTYQCCPGHELSLGESECKKISSDIDNRTNNPPGTNSTVPNSSLLKIIQQIFDGALRSQILASRTTLDNNEKFEDDDFRAAMMPVVFLKNTNTTNTQIIQQVKTENSTFSGGSEQKIQSHLHLSIQL